MYILSIVEKTKINEQRWGVAHSKYSYESIGSRENRLSNDQGRKQQSKQENHDGLGLIFLFELTGRFSVNEGVDTNMTSS